jgi:hypothetical protein
VLVVEPDRQRRHELVAALVASGADYLGADHVIVQPGSRTVLAFPTPLDSGKLLTADQVALAMTVSLVVAAEHGDEGGGVDRLARAHGCARLLVAALSDAPDAHEVVRCVSGILAAAAVWSVPAEDPRAFAALVGGLDGPVTHELVTWRRPLSRSPDVVTVRFARGGVVVDVEHARALEVDESELFTVDTLGWSVIDPDPAGTEALLAQLADAGVDLRGAHSWTGEHRTARRPPGRGCSGAVGPFGARSGRRAAPCAGPAARVRRPPG